MIYRIVFLSLVGVTGSAALFLIFSPPLPDQTESSETERRPAIERFDVGAYDLLAMRGGGMYVGTVAQVRLLKRDESDSGMGLSIEGSFRLRVEKTVVGEPSDSIPLNFLWRKAKEDVQGSWDWETEWGQHPQPHEGMRVLLTLTSSDDAVKRNPAFPDRTAFIWELPEYDFLIKGFEPVAAFLGSSDDKTRLAAFQQMCQSDSYNVRYFAHCLGIRMRLDPNTASEVKAVIGELSGLLCSDVREPWNRLGPDARRAVILDFVRDAAPYLEHGYLSHETTSRELSALLAFDAGLANADELRTAAADWLWGELGATGPANAESDKTRRAGAIIGLNTLAAKKGPTWVLSLFQRQGRDELLRRVESASAGLPPKEAEVGRNLLARLKSK